VTWDLFSSADPPPPRRELNEARNADLARAVAAKQAEAGFPRRTTPEWTVAEVNTAARELIEGVLPPLWVAGEVGSINLARSGHIYFTLRDDAAQLRCVMYRDDARRLPATPREGMKVRALGRLTLYEARGEFQLIANELEAQGEGLYKLAFDQLRAKLDQEGLTAPGRKRRLPAHPDCVGVVTSQDAAVLRDIAVVVRRRAPWTRLVLAPTRVQGEGAAERIASAIRRLGASGCVDVMIVGRGGGSTEDLWAFNEEPVARAIAESPVPVISAVGHETDVTLADLVADLRAPTPSAAAEAAVPDGRRVRQELQELREAMAACMTDRLDTERERVFGIRMDLKDAIRRTIARRAERVAAAAAQLNALSPLSTLARGYAVPLDPGGRLLRRAADFVPDARFSLRVADGSVPCRVDGRPAMPEQ
jgi:exodeoxyribonuclease VII large subunit